MKRPSFVCVCPREQPMPAIGLLRTICGEEHRRAERGLQDRWQGGRAFQDETCRPLAAAAADALHLCSQHLEWRVHNATLFDTERRDQRRRTKRVPEILVYSYI